jgi:ribosomal protein L37AE/L43A
MEAEIMVTMWKSVCPVCSGSVTNVRKRPGMYWCNHCHREFEAKDLKLIPIKEASDANPFRP